MSGEFAKIRSLIDSCSTDDRIALITYLRRLTPHPLEDEWGIDADTIMNAILRSSDLTKRGVRGIIAEAVFESAVIPSLIAAGWQAVSITGDQPYDVLLKGSHHSVRIQIKLQHDVLLKGSHHSVRIQIKLQRLEKTVPKLYYPMKYAHGSLFVVEVQRTRGGTRKSKEPFFEKVATPTSRKPLTFETRPYRFGEFDILAVNMHPSSRDWKDFRYTLCSRLLPRTDDSSLIRIFQPVSAVPGDIWTNDITVALSWLEMENDSLSLADLLTHS